MAANKKSFSFKQVQIDKATSTMVIFISLATASLMFGIFAGKALLEHRSYQAKIISKKEKAKKQLQANLKAKEQLVTSYKTFVGTEPNIIGGNPAGEAEDDGDNARIILDALPSKYDFPALATSLENILKHSSIADQIEIQNVTGVDDEIAQGSATTDTPAPVEMPFTIGVNGSYGAIQELIDIFERSIRPIQIKTLTLTGSEGSMSLSIDAKTFYQPEKKVNIKEEVVR